MEPEVGGASSISPSHLVGTFGEVSPKVDVYAFGVVLYKMVSTNDTLL